MKHAKKSAPPSATLALVRTCHLLYEKGMVVATDGNVSVRLPNGNILTTRSGICKGTVTRNDLVEVSPQGDRIKGKGKPSTELAMHLFIYNQRPDVKAVVHAHPIHATGFAVAGIALDKLTLPEVIVGLGIVPLAAYATPSTHEVADSLAPFVKSFDSILLANHGVVSYGSDLRDAWHKMEKVEQAAHIALVARVLGGERVLTSEEVRKLAQVSPASYGKQIPTTILHAIKT